MSRLILTTVLSRVDRNSNRYMLHWCRCFPYRLSGIALVSLFDRPNDSRELLFVKHSQQCLYHLTSYVQVQDNDEISIGFPTPQNLVSSLSFVYHDTDQYRIHKKRYVHAGPWKLRDVSHICIIGIKLGIF